MAGYQKNSIDFDSLLDPIGGLTKRNDVNYQINGTDISNLYAQASDGEAYESSNYLSNGTDIGALFAKLNSVIYSGKLYTIGYNIYGSLGLNNTTDQSTWTQVGSLTTWKYGASGCDYALCVKSDGTLWSWGSNACGQLGLGHNSNVSSPIQVGSSTNWKQPAAGGSDANDSFSYGIKTDGTIWSWGWNLSGQLGNGSSGGYNTIPYQIGSLTNWKYVSCGQQASGVYAVKTDGTLWTWGGNNNGNLGQGDYVNRSSPTQVGALTNWKVTSGGARHSLGVKTNGTLWGCGYNTYGALGQNNTDPYNSPVQIGSGTSWVTCAAAYDNSHAINSAGDLYGTGSAPIGTGSYNSNYSVLTYVSSPYKSISGRRNAYSGVSSGYLLAWGNQQAFIPYYSQSYPTYVGYSKAWKQCYQGSDFLMAIQ